MTTTSRLSFCQSVTITSLSLDISLPQPHYHGNTSAVRPSINRFNIQSRQGIDYQEEDNAAVGLFRYGDQGMEFELHELPYQTPTPSEPWPMPPCSPPTYNTVMTKQPNDCRCARTERRHGR